MKKTKHSSHVVLLTGVSIGVSMVVWLFLTMLLHWYRQPQLIHFFFAIIVVELGGLYWGLTQLLTQYRSYLRLVIEGIHISAVAAVMMFVFSYLLSAFVFPSYFSDVQKFQREIMVEQKVPEERIQSTMAILKAQDTPFNHAMTGLLSVLLVGVLGSTVFSMFLHPSLKK